MFVVRGSGRILHGVIRPHAIASEQREDSVQTVELPPLKPKPGLSGLRAELVFIAITQVTWPSGAAVFKLRHQEATSHSMKKLSVALALFVSSIAFAQSRPTVYLEPQQGFETYIAAAIAKKGVPVDVVTDKAKATYVLRSAPVEVKSESTGGKIARCLFASCAGIEDKGNVSVQLIEVNSTKMIWAYSVNKQRGGSKNEQSMAEAIAKHFKEFLPNAPALSAAPAPMAAPAPAPVASVADPALAPTPVAYQTPAAPAPQVVSQDNSLGDAARKAKQHKECLELAKDNSAITCN